MSYEAWGTPPGPEPRYCPLCDQESHSPDCELGKMQARAFLAEQTIAELLAALERLSFAALCRDSMTGDQCRLIDVKAELAVANVQAQDAIASVKSQPN